MILINEGYKQQLQEIHKNPKSFYRGLKVLGKIESYLSKYKPNSLLDFGCGKGDLHTELSKFIKITDGYDPGIPKFEKLPVRRYESLLALDVLEHVEPEMLDDTLKTINNLFTSSCYFIVANYPSKKYLPDGRNAHLIVEHIDWWLNKFEKFINGKVVYTYQTPIQKVLKTGKVISGEEYIFIIEK